MITFNDLGIEKQETAVGDSLKFLHFKRPNSVFSIHITFLAGALYQPPDKPGLAHFVEHMLMKESKNYPDLTKTNNIFSEKAVYSNAHTAPETMSLVAAIPDKEDIETILDIYVDQLKNPLILDDRVEKERGAIQQELRMQQSKITGANIRRLWSMMMNKKGNLVYPTSGTVEQVGRLKKSDIFDYYRLFEQQKMYITSSGPIELSWLQDYFKKNFSFLKRGEDLKSNITKSPQMKIAFKKLTDIGDNIELHLGTRISSKDYVADRAAIVMMQRYLGAKNGRLKKSLREEKGLVYAASADYYLAGKEYAYFAIWAPCSKANLSSVVPVILEQINMIKDGKIDASYFEVIKKMFKKEVTRHFEKSIDIVESHINSNLFENYSDRVQINEAIDKLNVGDLQSAAKKYLDESRLLWSFSGNIDETDIGKLVDGEVTIA